MNPQLIGKLKYIQSNECRHEKSKPREDGMTVIQFTFAVSEEHWHALSHLPLSVGMGKHCEPQVCKMRLLQNLPVPGMVEAELSWDCHELVG